MVCDYTVPGESFEERRERILSTLTELAGQLASGSAKIVIGPDGAIAFEGWSEADRRGMTDACAYSGLQLHFGFELQQAVQQAELMSGRSVDFTAIQSGRHSHDGGRTWHPGH